LYGGKLANGLSRNDAELLGVAKGCMDGSVIGCLFSCLASGTGRFNCASVAGEEHGSDADTQSGRLQADRRAAIHFSHWHDLLRSARSVPGRIQERSKDA